MPEPNDLPLPYRRAVLEAVPCAVLVFGADHRVIYWNPQAEQLTGYTAEEMVGHTCQGLQVRLMGGGEQRRTATFCPVEGDRRAGEAELELVRKDGRGVRVLARTTAVEEHGRLLGYVQMLLDLSILAEARGAIRRLERTLAGPPGKLVSDSPPMQEMLETLRMVAPTDATVFISGETGTGKELVARDIHALSPRADGPFLAVNCGALPETLLESELFGHVRGAFTGADVERQGRFEQADGGTLLLDEITEMPPGAQVKLLRVLQEREVTRVGESTPRPVDVRILAATNRSADEAVQQGKLREDLYFRLNVVKLHVPPLRDRREDIPHLVEQFLRELNDRYSREVRRVSPEAMEVLLSFRWPGNVRQLRHAIEHSFVVTGEDVAELPASALPVEVREGPAAATGRGRATSGTSGAISQRSRVQQALRETGGNKTAAAARLGVSRAGLYKMLKRLGIGS
jgi:two-component system, NtrC family, response regulator HydG